ncbi:MAG: YraN family protein [Pseudomonadota bacterium]
MRQPFENAREAHHFGADAERAVAAFLIAGEYDVLGQRLRIARDEVDVVACKDDTVAFVEVKARRRGWSGATAVDRKKRARMVRAALAWLAENERYQHCGIRFDVALVWPGARLEYLENAFEAEPGFF